jgi:hypothetical protein
LKTGVSARLVQPKGKGEVQSMKRIHMAGLCLVAVLAFATVGVASASATLPEFSKSGVKFKATSGAGKLLTEAGHEVSCSSDEVKETEGEVTGAKTTKATVRFKGCKALGLFSCQTSGAASGEIISETVGLLVYTNSSKKEVAELLSPKSGTVFAKFSCEGLETITVEGNVLGAATPVNTKSKSGKLVFTQSGGKQSPSEYEETAGGTKKKASLKSTGTGFEGFGPEGSGITSEDAVTFASELEIKA